MAPRVFAAVDVGASSGRVMAGIVEGERLELREVHRFPNGMVERDGHLRWDISRIWSEVLAGLGRLAAEHPEVESVGIDTWAVDYGLLDEDGELLADPVAYRDGRTSTAVDAVHRLVGPEELYAVNGLQFLPFNTLYQLEAEKAGPLWERAAHVVLLPDLLAYWLTGELRTEATNASTTGLTDVRTGDWSVPLLGRLGIPAERLPPIQPPGEVRGAVRPEMCRRTGLAPSTVVTAVGSHDTASAVVGVPSEGEGSAFVSCGTWSLVGIELPEPVLSAASRAANFTNELGVDGRIRFLRNSGGLWILEECIRSWRGQGLDAELEALLDGAARAEPGPVVDVEDAELIPPGDMPDRVAAWLAARGLPAPGSPAGMARCLVESLAAAYARTVDEASRLSGRQVDVIHVVGGGSRNDLLCRLTADRAGRPVVAGPVEATALGNVVVQARARGAASGSLEDLRGLVARSSRLRRFEPAG